MAAFVHVALLTRQPPTQFPQSTSSRNPPYCSATIIVPGKFDALHVGHRALAEEAAKHGTPMLLSFSGMAAALRWPPRHPVVAASQRSPILTSWSAHMPTPVTHRVLRFADIRHLSGQQFLELLREKFDARGIVCGADWRFGHDASCGVHDLRHIAPNLGIEVSLVPAVMVSDGIASSTRVREALRDGNVELVRQLLGRTHRVVGVVESAGEKTVTAGSFVNAVPGDGRYAAVVRVLGRTEPYQSEVDVIRQDGEARVVLNESEDVYCAECDIYVDFMQRLD